MNLQDALPVSLVLAAGWLAAPASAQRTVVPQPSDLARLRHAEVQDLALPQRGGPRELVFVELMGQPRALDLQSFSMLSQDFQLLVQTDEGMEVHPTPEVPTYIGTVGGLPGSNVIAAVVEGDLFARVVLPEGREFWIQPDPARAAHQTARHIAYERADLAPGDATCSVAAVAPPLPPAEVELAPGFQAIGSTCFAVTDIAFDTDFEYFLALGSSVTAAFNDIVVLMVFVQSTFTIPGISYEIGTIIVRSSSADPYSDPDSGCGGFGILDEFQAEWNANQTATKRDMAALMTGKALTGNIIGCAFTGSVCTTTSAYCINEVVFSPFILERAALVSHEVGHIWGASHCDSDPNCAIMCATITACSGNVTTFSAGSQSVIEASRSGQTCLDDLVFVDGAHTGSALGTSASPFTSVCSGAGCSLSAAPRRDVRIEAGTYGEAPVTLTTSAILRAQGGTVVVD